MAKKIQEKLDDEPYWQEERTQIEEEVKSEADEKFDGIIKTAPLPAPDPGVEPDEANDKVIFSLIKDDDALLLLLLFPTRKFVLKL